MVEYEDKKIMCAETGCGTEFTFEAGEQRFFASKDFKPPRYCATHRAARKAAKERKEVSPFNPKNWEEGSAEARA